MTNSLLEKMLSEKLYLDEEKSTSSTASTDVGVCGLSLGYIDVIVTGSLTHEVFVYCQERPNGEESVQTNKVLHSVGGKGLNTAIAASNMAIRDDLRVRMLGSVGNDKEGDHICVYLETRSVDINYIMCSSLERTGKSFITVMPDSSKQVVTNCGANRTTVMDDALRMDFNSTKKAVAVANFETDKSVVQALFNNVKDRNGLTILNPWPLSSIPETLARITDILVVNEKELDEIIEEKGDLMELVNERYNKKKCKDKSMAIYTLVRALELGALIVTKGKLGCTIWKPWASDTKGVKSYDPDEQPDEDRVSAMDIPIKQAVGIIVDRYGVGDCFIGSLATALAEGYTIEESAKLANTMACNSLSSAGASTSYRPRKEVIPGTKLESRRIDFRSNHSQLYYKIEKKKKKMTTIDPADIGEKLANILTGHIFDNPEITNRNLWDANLANRDGIETVVEGGVIHLDAVREGEHRTRTEVLEEFDRLWIVEFVETGIGDRKEVSRVCVKNDGEVILNESGIEDVSSFTNRGAKKSNGNKFSFFKFGKKKKPQEKICKCCAVPHQFY